MQNINWIEIVLAFLTGFGFFLFGMEFFADGLQKAAGNKMKSLLEVLTTKRLMAVLVGAGITAIIQSSSATTIMVVGFVNAGLMSLTQAVGVIMGANIGTTTTAWIVSLGEWTEFLQPTVLGPVCLVVGVAFTTFLKKPKLKQIGQILFGFGALFFGLEMMSKAVEPISKLQETQDIIYRFSKNPMICVAVGAVVTAVIQSSTASVGILQAMAAKGMIPWNVGLYIIFGQNIGTCVTAILSSVGANKNARRAAVIHLLFNVMGTIIFGIIGYLLMTFVLPPEFGASNFGLIEISMVHTAFNVCNTVALFPFAKGLVYLAEKIIPGDDEATEEELQHLDDRILETPSIAVNNAVKEVVRMGNIAIQNTKTAIEALKDKDLSKVEEVYQREETINLLQHGINHYLVKLSNLSISENEHGMITSLFHTVSDLERVGDHAENIAELAELLIKEDQSFSDVALEELDQITSTTLQCIEMALQAYEFNDKMLAKQSLPLEQKVDKLESAFRSSHIKRLAENKCSSIAGVVFLDAISNLERISDHASNIAMTILDENKSLTTEDMVIPVTQ